MFMSHRFLNDSFVVSCLSLMLLLLLVVPCLFGQSLPLFQTRFVAAFSRLSTYDQAKTSILEHSGLRDGRASATRRVRRKEPQLGTMVAPVEDAEL